MIYLLSAYAGVACAGGFVLFMRLHDGRTYRGRLVPKGWRDGWAVLVAALAWPVYYGWIYRTKRERERKRY